MDRGKGEVRERLKRKKNQEGEGEERNECRRRTESEEDCSQRRREMNREREIDSGKDGGREGRGRTKGEVFPEEEKLHSATETKPWKGKIQ